MKKLLTIIALMLVLVCALASCKKSVEQGPQGEQGETGPTGPQGPQGEAGVTPTFKVENGDLLVSYDNGNTWTSLGHIQGADGESSQDETPQELDFYMKDDGTYSVAVGNAKYLSSINIPATYKGKAVTEIANKGFFECELLKSITLPNSITAIGEDAFRHCSSLTGVYITDIAAWCNITFSNYSSNPLCYANKLYLNNELVTELVIPDSVTTIGFAAFYNCSSLTSVVIGDSVTTIGDYAFAYCRSLTDVVISDSVTTIGDDAFELCDSLTSVVIPDSVTTIGNSAFSFCSSITSVVIPDSVTTIGDGVFGGCDSLTSVVIGDSVKTIGNYAFQSCSSLTSVVIGDRVTTIGDYAFDYCDSLTDVYYTGSEVQWAEISIGSYNGPLTYATRHYNYVPEE